MILKLKIQKILLFFLSFPLLWTGAFDAYAEDWVIYTEHPDLYEMRLPHGYTTEEGEILLGSEAVASVQNIVGRVNPEGTDGSDKTYNVHYVQTLGSPINKDEIIPLLKKQMKAYKAKFEPYNSTLIQSSISQFSPYMKIGDMHIKYDDPIRGPSHIKARIHLSNVSRMEQSVLGSKASVSSFRSKSFFDSAVLHDGYLGTRDILRKAWPAILSPLNIFTAYLPDPDQYFIRREPRIHHSKRYERLSFQFFDPFLSEYLTYNIHAYRIEIGHLFDNEVVNILQNRHLKRRGIYIKNEAFQKIDRNTIEAIYPLHPSKANNFSQMGRVRANFVNNYLLVHEFWGPENIVNGSSFANNIMATVEFHPKRAERLYKRQMFAEQNAQEKAQEDKAP